MWLLMVKELTFAGIVVASFSATSVWKLASNAAAAEPTLVVDGGQSAKSNGASQKLGFDFQLQVVDSNGNPVPQAVVEIRSRPLLQPEQVRRGELLKKESYGTKIKSDARGQLELTMARQPKYFVVDIEQPGYGPCWAEWNATDEPD